MVRFTNALPAKVSDPDYVEILRSPGSTSLATESVDGAVLHV